MVYIHQHIHSTCTKNFSALKIQERHLFLRDSIGYLEEENQCYIDVWKYFDGSVAFLICGTFFQWTFYMIYNRNLHPFKDIIMYTECETLLLQELSNKNE